jgi:carboxypeptidase Taq
MKGDLDFVREQQKEIIVLGQANALLSWDQETYMCSGGIDARAMQSSLLSRLAHERMTDAKLFAAVNRLLDSGRLKGDDKIMIEKLHKYILRSRKIPKEHVEAMSHAVMMSGPAWRDARRKQDWKIFEPHLKKIIDLKIAQAKYIGLSGHLYNSLLDEFEDGMTAEQLKPIFERLKFELVELLKKIEGSANYKKQRRVMSVGKFSETEQRKFVDGVARRIGLGEKNSRIDLSEHPFTTKIGYGDVRITTAFRRDLLFSFGSTVHESGHALYELGMPKNHQYDVLGDSPSLGLHESQSRFWENMIGKSRSFWKFYFPRFKKAYNLKGDFEKWYREVNFVEPGFIRIESDEVHYCLHVILRFEIEMGLIDGTISVRDLPTVWNAKMKELFGFVPSSIVDGALQDVHWSMGSVGYFPTYAIGTMYAAQLYGALAAEYSGLDKAISKGKFDKIGVWLQDRIHKHGSKYLADEVIRRVCGKGLDPSVYVKYLNEKFGKIYGF